MDHNKKPDKIREQSLTYNDYATIPDDGIRYELFDGVLQAMSPAPHPIHQLVCQEMSYALKQSCQNEYITFVSPIDVILSNVEVRQPDVVMIHRSRIDLVTNRGIEGSPDLIIEALSPSSIKRDRKDKSITYASFGIPEYWLVDPVQKTLEQYILKEGSNLLNEVYMDKQKVNTIHIPCISFTMDDIFTGIPEFPNA